MWRCDLAACLPVSWLLSHISADWSISAHQFHQSEMETALSLLQVYPMHSCTGPERLTHTGYHSSLKHMQELRSQCFTVTHRARIAQTRPFSSALACLPLLCSVLQTRAAFPQFRLMPTRLSWRSLHGTSDPQKGLPWLSRYRTLPPLTHSSLPFCFIFLLTEASYVYINYARKSTAYGL
jgi:hypothetical protein